MSNLGEIGPAVGQQPEDLIPVVLASLDRVAKMQEPETFGVFCTTPSWWLINRLRGLGFRVYWPAWIMSSVPLPGLDRYLPRVPHDCCEHSLEFLVWDNWHQMQPESCSP